MQNNEMYNGHYTIPQRMEPKMSYVRVLHAVPDAPNVDIYTNDKLIARNLAFGDSTPYTPVSAGNYMISVYPAGTKTSPVLTNMLTVQDNTYTTVAAAGMLDTIGLLAMEDASEPMNSGKAMVRFLHLSPDAPAVDITLPDGTVIFRDVSYKEITPYLAVEPMSYTLQVRPTGTSDVVLTVPNVRLEPNQMYTAYAIGLAGGRPELEALLLMDEE